MKKKIFIIFILFLVGSGCSTLKVRMKAEDRINNDVLLPVDIIVVSESMQNEVMEIGPEEWFGHSLRERLTEIELHSLAISGGEKRKVKVKRKSRSQKVIVYADYDNSTDRNKQQVIIVPKKFRRTHCVEIMENEMRSKK